MSDAPLSYEDAFNRARKDTPAPKPKTVRAWVFDRKLKAYVRNPDYDIDWEAGVAYPKD
jgi:hypothetical protein